MLTVYLLVLSLALGLCLELTDRYRYHFDEAVRNLERGNDQLCENSLIEALKYDPSSSEANGILGSLYTLQGRAELGVKFLSQAIASGAWSDATVVASYIEALRLNKQYDKSIDVYRNALATHPGNTNILLNGGLVFLDIGDTETGIECLVQAATSDPSNPDGWLKILENLNMRGLFVDAEPFAISAALKFPDNGLVQFNSALVYHYQSKFDSALVLYLRAFDLRPDLPHIPINIGAVYQAMGQMKEARSIYEDIYHDQRNDAGFLNNFGSLLLVMNENDRGVELLKKALALDPFMENAMVNLGSHYQDEGELVAAKEFFQQAAAISPQVRLLEMRIALLISPVVSSWDQMIHERNQLYLSVKKIISMGFPPENIFCPLDSSLDRIHFYLVYSGLNDRGIQENIAQMYQQNIRNLSKMCALNRDKSDSKPRIGYSARIKVGFMSKFFGVYEPHGMLLEGVMRYLPRDRFEVHALPISISDKPISPVIENAVDNITIIMLDHVSAFHQLCEIKLDILIFADTLSEPMGHFLAYSRIAPIQIAFWGNPVTSGSPFIDYFVSSDFMEHPYRSKIPARNDPYTEQVVLLEGQGIWYSSPESEDYRKLALRFNISTDHTFTREEFGLQKDWFVFFCPQSLFKIHPLFDNVLAAVLRRNPDAHLVITGGRKKRWTDIFVGRLNKTLGPDAERCHIVDRVSSNNFLQLLKISDVLLHPFPFDGSKTAADGVGTGIPFVTLPAEYLRGRMGASLLRTLNMPELVAKNMSDYIEIASRLCNDFKFYHNTKKLLLSKANLIWEDMEYPHSWAQFLSILSDLPPLDWKSFILSTGRDISRETEFATNRKRNQKLFDLNWGPESWLMRQDKNEILPEIVRESYIPPIFNDWYPKEDQNPSQSEFIGSLRLNDMVSVIQEAALSGNLEVASNEGKNALQLFPHDPTLLLEVGIIEYFSGRYESALNICEVAASIIEQRHLQSSEVYGCIGVASIYLLQEEKAFSALRRAHNLSGTHSDVWSSIFNFPQEAIEVSMISALSTFRRYHECAAAVCDIMSIPSIVNGGALVLLLSTVRWSPSNYGTLQELEEKWRQNQQLILSKTQSLSSEIHRLQSNYPHLLENAQQCMNMYDIYSAEGIAVEKAAAAFADLVSPSSVAISTISVIGSSAATALVEKKSSDEAVLVTQYFERGRGRGEPYVALLKNLANPLISEIILLNEDVYDFASLPHSHKIHQIHLGQRLTFSTAFRFINNALSNRVIIFANADIYFDDTISQLFTNPAVTLQNTIYALGKWTDWSPIQPYVELYARVDSQDAWIFQSPLPDCVVLPANFYMGLPRCDNRIASIFTDCGYEVVNPLFNIHAIEVLSEARANGLYTMKDAVVGEGKLVFLSDLL